MTTTDNELDLQPVEGLCRHPECGKEEATMSMGPPTYQRLGKGLCKEHWKRFARLEAR